MHDSGAVDFEFFPGVDDVLLEALYFFFQQFDVNLFPLARHLGRDAILFDEFGFFVVNSVLIVFLFEEVGDLFGVIISFDFGGVGSFVVGLGGVTVVA